MREARRARHRAALDRGEVTSVGPAHGGVQNERARVADEQHVAPALGQEDLSLHVVADQARSEPAPTVGQEPRILWDHQEPSRRAPHSVYAHPQHRRLGDREPVAVAIRVQRSVAVEVGRLHAAPDRCRVSDLRERQRVRATAALRVVVLGPLDRVCLERVVVGHAAPVDEHRPRAARAWIRHAPARLRVEDGPRAAEHGAVRHALPSFAHRPIHALGRRDALLPLADRAARAAIVGDALPRDAIPEPALARSAFRSATRSVDETRLARAPYAGSGIDRLHSRGTARPDDHGREAHDRRDHAAKPRWAVASSALVGAGALSFSRGLRRRRVLLSAAGAHDSLYLTLRRLACDTALPTISRSSSIARRSSCSHSLRPEPRPLLCVRSLFPPTTAPRTRFGANPSPRNRRPTRRSVSRSGPRPPSEEAPVAAEDKSRAGSDEPGPRRASRGRAIG